MNEQEVAWLLSKAATGQDLFAMLCSDPKAAAEALGLPMTEKEARAIRKYAEGMKKRAERGGTQILIYPLPELSGPPGKPQGSKP